MSSVFEICPGRKVGEGQPCFIIAEIGQNHQGDIKIAKEMIKMVKDCGADCAKFQKSELEHKFNKEALARPYNSEHSWGATYGDHKRFLEFSHDEFRELKRYAEEDVGICFTASAMDLKAGDVLDESMLIVKVAEPHGVRPQWLCNVVGRKLLRDIAEDATLLNEDVEGWQDPEKCLSLNGDAVSEDVAVSKSDGVEISDG